jgi:hypothetical protein
MFKTGDKVTPKLNSLNNVSSEYHGKLLTVIALTGTYLNLLNDKGKEYVAHPDNWEIVPEIVEEIVEEKGDEKPMSKFRLNYHVLNESVVLNYGGRTTTISSGDERFPEVISAIQANRLEDIPEIVEIERRFNGDGITLKDGLFVAGNETLPSELEDRIIKYRAAKIPYDSLLKFWENLKNNPSFNSRKMLFKFLEHNGHPITEDGCFIAYRGVSDDFKDLHTKTFDNKPGSVCEMPRNQVDENPNNTCSSGLHVACFGYARDFGPKLIEVKVNPADVVAVPTDYNGTKMRVCKFEVVQEGEKPREELVYPEAHEAEEESEELDEDECENCGAERDPFANYCHECGESIN